MQFWACFIVTKINTWQIKAMKYKETELFNITRRSQFSFSHKTLKSPFWNLQHSHKIIIVFTFQEETGILQKCRTAVEALFPCLSPNIYNCWSFGIPHSPALLLCAWMNIPGYRTGLANCIPGNRVARTGPNSQECKTKQNFLIAALGMSQTQL